MSRALRRYSARGLSRSSGSRLFSLRAVERRHAHGARASRRGDAVVRRLGFSSSETRRHGVDHSGPVPVDRDAPGYSISPSASSPIPRYPRDRRFRRPPTAALKFTHRTPDEDIPGTPNVGHALPVLTEALIFIAAIVVDPRLLIAMIVAWMSGAWLVAGVVAHMPRRAIQVGMGSARAIAAALFVAANLHWMPAGGSATAVSGIPFTVAVVGNFVLGALMTLGIGLYAPCLIMLSLLGLDPRRHSPS